MSRSPEFLSYLGKQRPQQLFRMLNKMPAFGVGRAFTRVIWKAEDVSASIRPSYWTVTKVVPNKDLKSGKVWGVLYWRGQPELRKDETPWERRVRSPLKKQWKVLPKDYNN